MENTQDLKANSIDQETLADSLDDLFEKYENEICCDLKIRDRGLDPVKETSLADTLSSKYIFGGKIQIHEESDRTKEVSHTLPLGLVDKEGDRATLIAEQRHTKNKVFQRSFENYMTPEIFRQVFNDALLDKPEMASLYYPRTDSLLIALFNRVKA